MFTFQCTRCRKKPAIVTRGRKVFLCADCATGSLWYDMVGSLVDDEGSPAEPEAAAAEHVEVTSGDHGVDPWETS